MRGWGKEGRAMAAILHTSVLAPHLLPRITSGDRYCRVWMSFVKWWPTQHAFPRSAILTEMISAARSGSVDLGWEGCVLEGALLSRLMPDTSSVMMSLKGVS